MLKILVSLVLILSLSACGSVTLIPLGPGMGHVDYEISWSESQTARNHTKAVEKAQRYCNNKAEIVYIGDFKENPVIHFPTGDLYMYNEIEYKSLFFTCEYSQL